MGGQKLSRASFSTFRCNEKPDCTFVGSEKVQNRSSAFRKGANPTFGKIAPRIVADMKPSAYIVYFLVDPIAPRWPRYVGMTSNPEERERKHQTLGSGNDALYGWKLELRAAGRAAKLVPYRGFATEAEARDFEWRLMRRWRRRGLCDCNTERDGRAIAWRLSMDAKHRRLAEKAS